MSKIRYHGNEYRQCDNTECNFEIRSQNLITLMLKGDVQLIKYILAENVEIYTVRIN